MGTIQLSNNFRIRYDATENYYYLEKYDSATASWVALVKLDVPDNLMYINPQIDSVVVSTADIDTANITYLKSSNVNLNVTESGTPNITWSPFMSPNQGKQLLPIYMQYESTGVGATETITISVTPHYSDGSTNVIEVAKFVGDVNTTNATADFIPYAIETGEYIAQLDVSVNTTATTSVATVIVEIVAYQM